MSHGAPMRTVITIDGIDGSGKSTFARRLLASLTAGGAPGVLVSVDDFRRPVDWSAVAEAEHYYDHYYDLLECDRCLSAFLDGAPVASIPQFDPVSEQAIAPRSLPLSGLAVAILEGVFPLRVPATAGGLVVYLDASATEARRRIVERDRRKGRSRDEIERRIDRRYMPGQQRYHAAFDPRSRADIIIDNDRPGAARALRRDLSRAAPELRVLLDRALPPG